MFDMIVEQGVARLTLNRPAARNAIPPAAWADLAARLGAVGEARVLIVDAAPDAFCAGADLGDIAALAGDVAAAGRFHAVMRAALDALRDLPIATIAAIDGGCYGAGVALAMACDIRLAGAGARFAIPPARLGITYPQEDVDRLVRLVGPGQAARLLYGAETIDAVEAARIGLVEQAVADAAAGAAALAATIAGNSRSSIAGLKRLIARSGTPADAAGDALFEGSFASADFIERVAAIRTRRPEASA